MKLILPTPHRLWLKKNAINISALLFSFLFSCYLMLSTFGYSNGQIILSMHIWSDFWANIPLIRSFSFGDNFPPEYPIFPGERIRYHFLFFLLVGLLERYGVRIDIALNMLSILGMTGLLFAMYCVGKHLFKSRLAGWFAMLFVIFNSSLTWVYYIFGKLHLTSITDLITNKSMGTHGPYDDALISAFWKLNIFTNQRHLAFSFTTMFLGIWAIVYGNRKIKVLIGILLIVSLSWMHKAILLITLIQLGLFFLAKQSRRRVILGSLLVIVSLSLPGILYLNGDGIQTEQAIHVRPGFLYNSTSWYEFPGQEFSLFIKWIIYWLLNWGILPFTAILGWIVYIRAQAKQINGKSIIKKTLHSLTTDGTVWLMGAISIFVISNVVAFASDPATNHKLLNYSQFIFGIFSAGLIAFFISKKNIIAAPLLILLILGGVLDFFPLINDNKGTWDDIQRDQVASWIYTNTPRDSVFLNTSYSTNSVTTAGRKIYWGWDYFTGSIGYPLETRKKLVQPVLAGRETLEESCTFLKNEGLDYILLDNKHADLFLDVKVNNNFFSQNFKQSVAFPAFSIYSVELSCPNQ